MELTIKIPLSDKLRTRDPWTGFKAGDGDALGRILRSLADSWEGQMVTKSSPLTMPDGTVVGEIDLTY